MTTTTRVVRKGHIFDVEDGPLTRPWHFWDLWASGQWEGALFDQMDRLLPDNGCFFDVGAWVGPMSLWAGLRAKVIAIEPDADAFWPMVTNLAMNAVRDDRRCIQAAAAIHDGKVLLSEMTGWGNSSPSTWFKGGETREVAAINLGMLIEHEEPDLVKMDVEGSEVELMAAFGPMLRLRKVPVLLSVHAHSPEFDAEMAEWNVQTLPAASEMYLCLP